MAHLRQLSERVDGVVIPIHHQRKDHGNGGRAGDRLRGHSSIEAAVDLALLVEREEVSSEITIKSRPKPNKCAIRGNKRGWTRPDERE